MKLECKTEDIKNKISQVERITGKNLTLPILNSILLIASGKSLKLRSTNLNLGIEVEIPVKIEKEGIVAISGSVLGGVFSNVFQNENVFLEGVDGNLLIKTKKSKIKLKGQIHDDFPTIPRVLGTSFEIESKKLIDGIKSVYYSSSVSDIKPEISSVFIYTNEDNLIFVSTDSFRLAEKRIKVKGLPEITGILIPFKNISEILRVFGESSSVLKQDLLNALKISNIFSDKFNQVNLNILQKEKVFELSSANNDIGENKTYLDAAITGENIELGFNYKYFLDCFQSITTDSISIKASGASSPLVINPVSDTSFTYLIMPMNR